MQCWLDVRQEEPLAQPPKFYLLWVRCPGERQLSLLGGNGAGVRCAQPALAREKRGCIGSCILFVASSGPPTLRQRIWGRQNILAVNALA